MYFNIFAAICDSESLFVKFLQEIEGPLETRVVG